jgi:hypothetical protein
VLALIFSVIAAFVAAVILLVRALPVARRLGLVSQTYRPERHYMRGPGPKWREKHVAAGRGRS